MGAPKQLADFIQVDLHMVSQQEPLHTFIMGTHRTLMCSPQLDVRGLGGRAELSLQCQVRLVGGVGGGVVEYVPTVPSLQ